MSRPTFADRSAVPGERAARTASPTFSKLLVLGLAGMFVVASVAFFLAVADARPDASPSPSGLPADASGAAGAALSATTSDRVVAILQASPAPVVSPAPSIAIGPAASPVPSGSLLPTASIDPLASASPLVDPAAIVELRMPFVPVTSFWATETAITRADLEAALTGRSTTWDRVLVPAADRAAIADALGVTIADAVEDAEPGRIIRVARKRQERVLGILRASDVTYAVRALGIGDRLLFGNERVGKVDNWPLVATVQGPAGSAWDQGRTWTLVAGGDSFTDRGIYERVVNRNKGLDYPFDGGTARVTGHYCCGPFVDGYMVPRYTLSGPKGVVRALTKDADLAIANHESPIPDNWVFHLHGLTFSGKPALTEIFVRGGIDWMSLANNHIGDFGISGVKDTRKNMARFGILFGGAGRTIQEARDFEIMEVNGTRVAILPCTALANNGVFAGPSSGGPTPCRNRYMLKDIQKAKAQADVVIVFPHWGQEYNRSPVGNQRQRAARWTAEGADLVVGAHSHVAGAIEDFDGRPAFYSLGNFIFDQNFRTETMEGVLLEVTFQGDRIVQMRLHPFLTHDQAQPNLLDPAKDDGKALMKAIRRVSFVDW